MESQMAEDAIRDGFTTIVAAGGDGTCSNVANTILKSKKDVRLAVIPVGTGNDFARTLGLERATPSAIADLVQNAPATRMDVGCVDGIDFFLNSCGFGFDVAVVHGLVSARWIGRNFVYIYSALREMIGFPGFEADVTWPGGRVARNKHLLIVIANGAQFGGGLMIAPRATVTDGMLDAVMIRDATRARRMRMFAAASRGTHERFGEVTIQRAAAFSLSFAEAPVFERDGELQRAHSRDVTVECLPRALNVVAGRNFA